MDYPPLTSALLPRRYFLFPLVPRLHGPSCTPSEDWKYYLFVCLGYGTYAKGEGSRAGGTLVLALGILVIYGLRLRLGLNFHSVLTILEMLNNDRVSDYVLDTYPDEAL